MKICGIVAEFNPFHNGHKYLIDEVKKSGITHTVAVMSGSFVQRGEPSAFDVSVRTRAALEGGVDLVLQLPVTKALSGAENFASGAVQILESAGCIDTLAFGSECGDAALLSNCADLLTSDEVNNGILNYLKSGITYAAAREQALRDLNPDLADLIKTPNNILAVEYITALKKLKSGMELFTVSRSGASHDSSEKHGDFAGAKEIRRMIDAGEDYSRFVPNYDIYKKENNTVDYKKLETAVLFAMRNLNAADIAKSPDVSEGIENRIASAARQALSIEELYSLSKTKRYTHARIRRIVMNSVLGISGEESSADVPYIRILGMNDRGAEIVRMMKEKSILPILSKTSDIGSAGEKAQALFDIECRATDLRSLCLKQPLPCGAEKDYKLIKI